MRQVKRGNRSVIDFNKALDQVHKKKANYSLVAKGVYQLDQMKV